MARCPRICHCWVGAAGFRVPDALQCVALLRDPGSHTVQCGEMGPGSAARHFVLRSVRGTRPWLRARLFQHRHCERSEAIQNPSAVAIWIASSQEFLSMTECSRHTFARSRLTSPELCSVASSSIERGRREGREPAGSHGRLCARLAALQSTGGKTTGQPETSRPSLRGWLERLMS